MAAQPAPDVTADSLDPVMIHVTEGCLLADLAKSDPSGYFENSGWQREGELWVSNLAGTRIVVKTVWPATQSEAAGCSFYSSDIQPEDYYRWLKERIGEPSDRAWDKEMRCGIWKINTKGRTVSIFAARDKSPETNETVSVLHVLQNHFWK
jgi:hypothetical protein